MKLGLLHAQKGMWKGKQLLSAEWVADATRFHTPDDDGGAGYGYQWWMGPRKAYFGLGLFTQMAIVFPEQEAVLALFSAIDGSKKLKPLIWKHFPRRSWMQRRRRRPRPRRCASAPSRCGCCRLCRRPVRPSRRGLPARPSPWRRTTSRRRR